jgi:sortase A
MTKARKSEATPAVRFLQTGWWFERLLWAAGCALLLIYIAARVHAAVMYRAALWDFERLAEGSPRAQQVRVAAGPAGVDFSLWSAGRVMAYTKILGLKLAPIAVISIRRLRLDVPVFEGTDGLTLNRGAGRIIGTAEFGHEGNIGIAGHRDGFFRGLEDVRMGDQIELAVPQQRYVYTVDNITIVRPDDVDVLRARSRPSLTLVTCYPFYLLGAASQRYIVQASLTNSEHESSDFGPAIWNMQNKEKTQ